MAARLDMLAGVDAQNARLGVGLGEGGNNQGGLRFFFYSRIAARVILIMTPS